jgi:hypothetical protein
MTQHEIDNLFPPSYAGVAQISDLRLALTHLAATNEIGGIHFYEVETLEERDNIEAENGDICKVQEDENNKPQTYIYWEGLWIILVENAGNDGTPTPTGTQVTEKFVIDTIQDTAQRVTLQHRPDQDFHIFVFLNGLYLTMGSSFDYTLSGQDLVFYGGILTKDDILTVKYTY